MPSLLNHDPLAQKKVTRERINQIRDELELSPIECDGSLYDFDEKSEKRMKGALDYWADLSVNDAIEWTLADNSTVILDKPQLQAVYADLLSKRAVRSAALHVRANEFKTMLPNVTERDVAGGWV